jgi:hypothetical protein
MRWGASSAVVQADAVRRPIFPILVVCKRSGKRYDCSLMLSVLDGQLTDGAEPPSSASPS